MPPVMDGYEHADVAHEKTIIDSTYHYGCLNTDRSAIKDVRNPNGWNDDGTRRFVWRKTNWLTEIKCGHITRATDPYCKGCSNL